MDSIGPKEYGVFHWKRGSKLPGRPSCSRLGADKWASIFDKDVFRHAWTDVVGCNKSWGKEPTERFTYSFLTSYDRGLKHLALDL